MNGQEGVLTVDDGTCRRNIRILKEGIRPLAIAPDDPDILRMALVKEKLVTDAEFQNTLSTWEPGRLFPGEFLLRRRVISQEQVENEIRKQLEELVFDVFTAADLQYEFRADETFLDHELFDPDGQGETLIYSVNGVLMESVRREDDWRRIRDVVRTPDEIFAPAAGTLPSAPPDGVDLPPRVYKTIRLLVSGERTVGRVVEDSPLSEYEVHQAIFVLHSAGLLRRVEGEEKRELAEKLRKMFKAREAVAVFQSIVADDPDDVDARSQLIALLEKTKQSPRLLVEEYRKQAEQLEPTNPDASLGLVRKILGITPGDVEALEKQVSLQLALGRREEALSDTRVLVKALKVADDGEAGAEILEGLLDQFPDEPHLFHETADMLIAAGRQEEAVRHLMRAALLYERRGDQQRIKKICDIVSRVSPTEGATLRRRLASPPGLRQRSAALVRSAALALVATNLLAVGAYFAFSEMESRRVFADVERDVDRLMQGGGFDPALSVLDEFDDAYPVSSKGRQVAELRTLLLHRKEELSRAESLRVEKRTLEILSRLAKGERLIQKGELAAAHEELTRLQNDFGGQVAEKHRRPLEKANEKLAWLRSYFAAAEEIASRARRAEGQDDIQAAHAIYRLLLQKYPYAPAAKAVRIPVRVVSTPPGADVTVDGQPVETTSPSVVRLSPQHTVSIRISRRGYQAKTLKLAPTRSWEVTAILTKVAEWAFRHDGPCDSYPVAFGSDVFFSNRNGQVFCIHPSSPERARWTFQIPHRADTAGGLGVWNGLLYTGAFDGNVYVIDTRTGELARPAIRASHDASPIKHAPSIANAEGVVVVSCGGRQLAAVSIKKGRAIWTKGFEQLLLGAPWSDGKTVHAFTADGRIMRLSHASGVESPPIVLDGELSHPGSIQEGKAFVCLSQGRFRAIDLANGRQIWETDLGSGSSAKPTLALGERSVLVPLSSGKLVCIDPETGSKRWERAAVDAIESEGLIFRNQIYIGTKSGSILRLDGATGEVAWRFDTGGATETPPRGILCRGLVHDGKFYQGSDDGHLYCLTLD